MWKIYYPLSIYHFYFKGHIGIRRKMDLQLDLWWDHVEQILLEWNNSIITRILFCYFLLVYYFFIQLHLIFVSYGKNLQIHSSKFSWYVVLKNQSSLLYPSSSVSFHVTFFHILYCFSHHIDTHIFDNHHMDWNVCFNNLA